MGRYHNDFQRRRVIAQERSVACRHDVRSPHSSGKSSSDRDVAALAGLYAEAAISARERIAAVTPSPPASPRTAARSLWPLIPPHIYEVAGTAGIVREQWDGLDLDRQHAIRESPLDHAVLASGTPGARRLDINRAQPHWRI